jgi:hypothetical protein
MYKEEMGKTDVLCGYRTRHHLAQDIARRKRKQTRT